ncbi:MAG: pyrroline-5-carboxylate reductase [Porticoccaceae bacterium]
MDSLLFVGGGNMARSLIGGIIAAGHRAEAITVCEPNRGARESLAGDFGVNVATELDTVSCARRADAIILAVKPQVMAQVAEGLAPALEHRPVVISIAAGINCHALSHWLGSATPIVRAMPNTPALLQQGATGLFADGSVTAEQKQLVAGLFSAIGIAEWVAEERLIDTITALSGSGPAYFFLLMELMAKVAEEMGLSAETAQKLTIQTAQGAANMAVQSSDSPATLRGKVTSPGGTTERALALFASQGLEATVRTAMLGAAERSAEMAAELTPPVTPEGE